MKERINAIIVVALVLSIAPTCAIIGWAIPEEGPTLWVGESLVMLLPVERGDMKLCMPGGTLDSLILLVDSNGLPKIKYKKAVFMSCADPLLNRATHAEHCDGLRKLAKTVKRKYRVDVVVVDPQYLIDMLKDQSFSRAPDGVHFSYETSQKLYAMASADPPTLPLLKID